MEYKNISSAVSSTRPLTAIFFIRTTKNGLVASPDPRFRPDLGFYPSGEPISSPLPGGRARGVRRKQKRGKPRGKFPRAWWPRLVGEKGRSSSSLHHLPHAVKACRRSVFAGHVASLYLSRTYRVWPHSPSPSPSPFSPVFSPRNISSNGGLQRQRGKQRLSARAASRRRHRRTAVTPATMTTTTATTRRPTAISACRTPCFKFSLCFPLIEFKYITNSAYICKKSPIYIKYL
jgi:hypothetical protein